MQARDPRQRIYVLIAIAAMMLGLCSVAQAQFDLNPLPPLPPRLLDSGDVVSGAVEDAESIAAQSKGAETAKTNLSPSTELQIELTKLEAAMKDLHASNPAQAERLANELQSILRLRTTAARDLIQKPVAQWVTPAYSFSQPRFEFATKKILQLQQIGDKVTASSLRKRLEELRLGLTERRCHVQPSARPQVHKISIKQGAALPHDLKTDSNRLTTGYAEVRLRYTQRPIILLLTASESIVWNITAAEGVRVFAVVTDSHKPQQIIGLENPTILNARQDIEALTRSTNGTRITTSLRSKSGETVAGSNPVTSFTADRYVGEPIVLGPDNAGWLAAYTIQATEQIVRECRQATSLLQSEKWRELRFSAIHTASFGQNKFEACQAEFNLAGPIERTLVPLPHRNLTAYVAAPPKSGTQSSNEFALTRDGVFVTVAMEKMDVKLTPIPLPATLSRYTKFTTMTYDSKRHRLLLATKSVRAKSKLVTFDIESAEWNELKEFNQQIVAITFVDREDLTWALIVNHKVDEDVAEFVRLDNTGNIVFRKPISESLAGISDDAQHSNRSQNVAGQLVEADGRAIFLSKPPVIYRSTSANPELILIAAETGEVLLRNTLRVHSGSQANTDDHRATLEHDNRISVIDEITDEISGATSAIESSELNETHRNVLRIRLNTAMDMLYGHYEKQQKHRIYVVGRHTAANGAKVRVTDTSAPILLVLCGHQRIDWQVDLSPGVDLQRIILAGPLPQTLATNPTKAIVEAHFGSDGFSIYDPRNAAQFANVRRRIAQLTDGKSVDAFAVAHHAIGWQTIGPDDGVTRVQMVRNELRSITTQALEERKRELVERLAQKRFYAIHQGTLPRKPNSKSSSDHTAAFRGVVREKIYWNEFSIRGPLIGRSNELNTNTRFGSMDPVDGSLCTGSVASLILQNKNDSNKEALDLRRFQATLGQLNGVAFDTEQNRILISASRGIFGFDLTTRELEKLRQKDAPTNAAFTYSPERNTAFALQLPSTGSAEIDQVERFNANGARLEPLRLSKAINISGGSNTTFRSSYGYGNLLQLIEFDGFLCVLRYHSHYNVRIVGGRRIRKRPTGRLSIIQLDSDDCSKAGDIVFESTVQPSLIYREIPVDELSRMWHNLGEQTSDITTVADHKEPNQTSHRTADQNLDLDSRLWNMASGGQATLDFLRNHYQPNATNLQESEVNALVKDLGSLQFAVRSSAFRKLQETGPKIEPLLTPYVGAENSSREVRERLRSLFSHWNVGAPQTPGELRQVRGLEVLSRIGLPEAETFLQQLRGEEYDDLVRQHAARVLEEDLGSAVEYDNPAMRFQQNLFVPK